MGDGCDKAPGLPACAEEGGSKGSSLPVDLVCERVCGSDSALNGISLFSACFLRFCGSVGGERTELPGGVIPEIKSCSSKRSSRAVCECAKDPLHIAIHCREAGDWSGGEDVLGVAGGSDDWRGGGDWREKQKFKNARNR